MTPLASSEFDEFFAAVHPYPPLPWQSDLVAEVIGTGRWPDVIDVPTGLGKTSLIDIAVFIAAASGCRPGSPGRRRVFFAIDRRIVVDEAFEQACVLATALDEARSHDSTLGRVAQALDTMHGARDDRPPLTVTRMRGGLTWAWRWLDRPDRPAVVVGTVDQLGSRVLFGGYGIGPRLRPIDAALSGVDSLLVVDEAHLAQPFVETLQAAASMPMVGDLPLSAPVIVTMSATPPSADDRRRIFPVRLRDAEVSTVAAQRIHAKKRLHGVRVPKNKVDPAEVLAGYASDLFDPGGNVAAVGVVCNTVQRARDVADRLRRDAELAPFVRLLTGRIRPYDRDRLVDDISDCVRADRDREQAEPIILVATQTIEVGANLNFDALVTESAPIDALIQRLGRLHRMGLPTEITRQCVVVHHEQSQRLYGDARERTWDRLIEELGSDLAATNKRRPALDGGIDASPAAMRALVGSSNRETLVVKPADTPALLPEIIGDWAATSGRPLASWEPFLHGRREKDLDVSLVWRADLMPDNTTDWQALVDRLPPLDGEQLDVPIGYATRWLRNLDSDDDIGDVPAAPNVSDDDQPDAPNGFPALRTPVLVWRGAGDGDLVRDSADLRRIRPGSVLIVPSDQGGCDDEGWYPSLGLAVTDLAEDDRGARRVVRLHPDTLPRWLANDDKTLRVGLGEVLADAKAADEADTEDVVKQGLRTLADKLEIRALGDLADHPIEVVRSATGSVLGLFGAATHDDRGRARRSTLADGSLYGTEADGSSTTGRRVTLDDHHAAVGERARGIAIALHLPDAVVESVAVAAGLHDLGKYDPRFQVMLHSGDPVAARAALDAAAPLAKSGMRPDDWAAARRASRASGLPPGYRHEVGSAQAIKSALVGRTDIDATLVVHLVASHHGNSRPLLPAIQDSGAIFDVRGTMVDPNRSVDFDQPARFGGLSERYGHWGLAMLESIVRLSDIGCSEEGL